MASIYQEVYIIILGLICSYAFISIGDSSSPNFRGNGIKKIGVNVLCLLVVAYIGFRPLIGYDMLGYLIAYNEGYVSDKEPGLWIVGKFCHLLNLNSQGWFFVVALIYFCSYLVACRNFSKRHGDYIYLSFLVAFSTFAYSTNTIRNGLAMSLLILAMSYNMVGGLRKRLFGFAFFYFALMTHKTTILPILCFFLAHKISFKQSLYFWVGSVVLSLIMGNQISNIFMNLGFDDRMDRYLQAEDMTGFKYVGFRWDFLLYSVAPIVLGYVVSIKRKIVDSQYSILLVTYVLTNAFWVMVIRAQFSDRFAYLSWFMYPIVLIYPILTMNVWTKNQGKYIKIILFAHLFFTMFMTLIYY